MIYEFLLACDNLVNSKEVKLEFESKLSYFGFWSLVSNSYPV